MFAIYKHEMRLYFNSLNAYFFTAFLLFFVGLYTMAHNINNGSASFEVVLGSMTFVFSIAVPLLTMRIVAEEKKQKTDQLLYSLPKSMTEIVLGKYLAVITVFLIPMVIICFYPLILSRFGTVSFKAAYGAIAGFALMGASLLAVGMFISSITENQVVAAVISFIVILFDYYVSSVTAYLPSSGILSFVLFAVMLLVLGAVMFHMTKNLTFSWAFTLVAEAVLVVCYLLFGEHFENAFAKMLNSLSVPDRFYRFVNGVFDWNAVVFFMSVIVAFVFLTIQSLEKRRWS